VDEVFFGGARGGGKTDGLMGDWIRHVMENAGKANGILFRKHYKQFEEIIRRGKQIFVPLGARWAPGSYSFIWGHGAQLKLRHLEKDDDAEEYQGHSYNFAAFDELTNWATPKALDKIRATLRSAEGVRCVLRSTGNPGGPGHNWVKDRYVSPAKPLTRFFHETVLEDGTVARTKRIYIPSKLDDNPALTRSDPDYWHRVVESAADNEALLKAWRWGIWDIVAGGMFDDLWRAQVHVVQPFMVPPSWRVDRCFDWGSSQPFSVQWWAESDGTSVPNGRSYPPRTLFQVAEWYGWNGKPNEGLRMDDVQIARQILQIKANLRGTILQRGTTIHPGPADLPDTKRNGVTIEDEMARVGVRWTKPDKSSRVTGWKNVRKMLRASRQSPMEEAGMFVFNTCRQFIRTFPVLPRDERNPDDVDTTAEDHPGDVCRYRVQEVRREVKVVKLKGF
jgi:hypothetical protein